MRFTIKRYRPTYFTGFSDEQSTISTIYELEQIPWIKQWKDDNFKRFSCSDYHIVCEQLDGKHWVVAKCENLASLGLPKWEGR